VLIVGLALSVALMGVAATFIARLLKRFPWLSYVGLLLIAWVAVVMVYEGAREVMGHSTGHGPAAISDPAH
jgi:predicted tellurium resistance membrane protein TerC